LPFPEKCESGCSDSEEDDKDGENFSHDRSSLERWLDTVASGEKDVAKGFKPQKVWCGVVRWAIGVEGDDEEEGAKAVEAAEGEADEHSFIVGVACFTAMVGCIIDDL
jgi:hypothetical protein